jgi:hypothetical protein
VQHLIDRTDDDACNATAGLINLFLDPTDEGIIVFEGALTGIDDITMPKTAILPEAVPMLFFLARGVEALRKKEGRVARENRLARYRCQGWYSRE